MRRMTVTVAIVLLATGAAAADQLRPSALKIEFATADGLRFTRPTPEFRQEIFLQSPAGAVPVGVSITPFASADGTEAAVTVTVGGAPLGAEATTAADGRLTLVLNAVLPSAGVYTSHLTVSSAGFLPLTVPIVVTRTRVPLSVQVKDLVTAEARPGAGGHVDFSIVEPSGQTARFQMPQLVALARQLPGGKQMQASPDAGDDALADVATVTMIGPAVAKAAAGLIELPGGMSQRFRATVRKFDSAGEYAGVVRVSSPTAVAVEEKAWFLVRRSPWFCFWLVFFGATASYVLQLWYKKLRPRLDRLRRAEALREELARALATPQLDQAARGLLDVYRTRADGAYAQIEADNGDAADRAIADIERKLPLVPIWSAIRAQVDALRPVDLGDSARQSLRGVEDVLRAEDATADAVAAQARVLSGLPAQIAATLRERVRTELTKLDAAVTARIAHRGPAGLHEIQSEARKAAGLEDATAALARLRELWTDYAQVLIAELRGAVAGAPPAYVTQPSWQEAQTRVGRLLDAAAVTPDDSYEWYQRAHRAYLDTLLKGLLAHQVSLGDRVSRLPQDDPGLAGKRAALEALTAATGAATARMAEGALDAATQNVSDAARAFEGLAGLFQPAPVRLGGTAAPAAAPVLPEGLGSVAAAFAFAPSWTPLVRPRPASRRFRDLINRWDLAATAVIAAVASLMGVMALWHVNLTWGSAADLTVALLWGLGLHGATFAGLSSLTDRFR